MSTDDVVKTLYKSKRKVVASVGGLEKLVPKSTSTTGVVPIAPEGLADVLSALLSQLRTTTTTLAMAFKPPLSPAAIEPYATKLDDQVARLVSCVLALSGSSTASGSSALLDEWRAGVLLIGERVGAFLNVLEASAKEGVEVREGVQSPYLAHTGLVHAAIEALESGMPRTEVEAVGNKWDGQRATVRDAWEEFKVLLEDDEGVDADDGMDAFGEIDDEWAILQEPTGSLSKAERKRAEAAKPVLALHQILHSTLPRYLPLLVLPREESYSDLLSAGSALVEGLDDAVAALLPGQDAGEINTEIEALNVKGRALATAFGGRLARAGIEAGEDKEKERSVATTFVQRWEAKLAEECARWEEARVSLADLEDALQSDEEDSD